MPGAGATLETHSTTARRGSSSASRAPRTRPRVEQEASLAEVRPSAHRAQLAAAISPVEHLDMIGARGRLDAYRSGAMSRRERTIWACRYPEEVPILNGEVEWIANSLADFD